MCNTQALYIKPRRLGLPNQIIVDSDSNDDKFRRQNPTDLDSYVEIGFPLINVSIKQRF